MTISRTLMALAIGALFGVGLAVSQMTNPEKVLAFLTVIGKWDPSLLLVMVAAVGITLIGYPWATSQAPLLESKHYLPTATKIDSKLVVGSAIFGIGWGLAGYCPGPAFAGLGSGSYEPWVFVAAMVLGGQLARIVA